MSLSNGTGLTFVKDFPPNFVVLQSVLMIDKNLTRKLLIATLTSTTGPWNLVSLDLKSHESNFLSVPDNVSRYQLGSINVASGILHLFLQPNDERLLGYTWNSQGVFEDISLSSNQTLNENEQKLQKSVVYLSHLSTF